MLNAILEWMHNPWVQITMTICSPLLAFIGGYFAGMTRILKKTNEESRKRVLQMIEDRKNESNAQRTCCWYD